MRLKNICKQYGDIIDVNNFRSFNKKSSKI